MLCIGPNISGSCSHLGAVEGEIVDAADVAMLNADSLLLSHCFRPAAVRALQEHAPRSPPHPACQDGMLSGPHLLLPPRPFALSHGIAHHSLVSASKTTLHTHAIAVRPDIRCPVLHSHTNIRCHATSGATRALCTHTHSGATDEYACTRIRRMLWQDRWRRTGVRSALRHPKP